MVWLEDLRWKLALDDDEAVSRRYVEVSALSYASIILLMDFFSNWMLMLFDFEDVSASSRTCHFIYSWFINPYFISVASVTGYHLWLKVSRA